MKTLVFLQNSFLDLFLKNEPLNSPVSYVCSSFKPPLVVSSNIVSHRCINEIKCKK
ncbi:BnaC08g40780D [Brassica napus]|uniref:BnaC08g40780D protein n=1 Tax=Brassica napus TaxID=3708 RepID=A0A078FNQ0_BRANA|nr:BnaC08g40780D [Brassica napus]